MRQPISPPFADVLCSPDRMFLSLEPSARIAHGILLVGHGQRLGDRVGDRVFEVKATEWVVAWVEMEEEHVGGGVEEFIVDAEGGGFGVTLGNAEGGQGQLPSRVI